MPGRPKDRGDQFPSDAGDTTPVNPIDNLSQRDFPVKVTTKDLQLRAIQNLHNPAFPLQNPNVPTVTVWAGVIQEHVRFSDYYHEYAVFRHDGKNITAKHIAHENAQRFNVNSSVIVSHNLGDEEYLIQGNPTIERGGYWAELTEDLDPNHHNPFGTVKNASAFLWYFDVDAREYKTDDVEIVVTNVTNVPWKKDDYVRVTRLTEDDTEDTPVWEVTTCFTTSVILGFVNAESGVNKDDDTFLIDNIEIVSGPDPRTVPGWSLENVTVRNTFSEKFDNNVKVIAFSRDDSDEFELDRAAGKGTESVNFELHEDMGLNDVASLAKPLDDVGVVDLTAADFYVVDWRLEHIGKASYVDFTGSTVAGFQGQALKFTDDYNATGKPGYAITTMEHYAEFLIVVLNDVYGAGGAITDVEYGLTSPYINGKLPVSNHGGGDLYVHDTWEVAESATLGDPGGSRWVAKYNAKLDQYDFWVRLRPDYYLIEGEVAQTTVFRTDTFFSIKGAVALNGIAPIDPGETPPDDEIRVKNDPPIEAAEGDIVHAIFNATAGADPSQQWTTATAHNIIYILKGLEGYDSETTQNLTHDDEGTVKWQEGDMGTGIVTEAISAATYADDVDPKTITFGSGKMGLYTVDTGTGIATQDGEDDVPVYTIANAETPIDKHIHWQVIGGLKMIIVEPC